MKNSNIDFSGLAVAVPVGFFDEITGEPTPNAIKTIGVKIRPYLQKEMVKVSF